MKTRILEAGHDEGGCNGTCYRDPEQPPPEMIQILGRYLTMRLCRRCAKEIGLEIRIFGQDYGKEPRP